MKSHILAIVLLSGLCMGAHGKRNDWDSVLERDEYGEPGDWCIYGTQTPLGPDGWASADGGVTARHWGTNRSIYIFGDTANGYPIDFTAKGAPGKFVNNSIMTVATTAPSHSGTGVTPAFYARKGTGNWGSIHNFTVMEKYVTKSWMPSFSADLGPSGEHWWWPGEAIVPEGTDKLVMFWDPVRCTDGSAYLDCPTVEITPIGCPEPVTWPTMNQAKQSKVCTIDSITGSAAYWLSPSCSNLQFLSNNVTYTPLETGLVWGAALLQDHESGYLYIFGVTRSYPFDAWDSQTNNVVLARSLVANIANYSQWEFLYTSGWIAATPPVFNSQLRVVANRANSSFTVDKVGTPARYVLVQQYKDSGGQFLPKMTIRIGKVSGSTPLMEWYDLPATAVSDANTWIRGIDGAGEADPPCGAGIYQFKGQWDTSNQAGNKLLVSYYCGFVNHYEEILGGGVTPADMNGDFNADPPDQCNDSIEAAYFRGSDPCLGFWQQWNVRDALVGRIRHYDVDLQRLQPWCVAPNCDH